MINVSMILSRQIILNVSSSCWMCQWYSIYKSLMLASASPLLQLFKPQCMARICGTFTFKTKHRNISTIESYPSDPRQVTPEMYEVEHLTRKKTRFFEGPGRCLWVISIPPGFWRGTVFEKTCHCRTVKPKGNKTKKERAADRGPTKSWLFVDRNMVRIPFSRISFPNHSPCTEFSRGQRP